jgi:hypothetical protein
VYSARSEFDQAGSFHSPSLCARLRDALVASGWRGSVFGGNIACASDSSYLRSTFFSHMFICSPSLHSLSHIIPAHFSLLPKTFLLGVLPRILTEKATKAAREKPHAIAHRSRASMYAATQNHPICMITTPAPQCRLLLRCTHRARWLG